MSDKYEELHRQIPDVSHCELMKMVNHIKQESNYKGWIERWVINKKGKYRRLNVRYICSECGNMYRLKRRICPNCGADMRGEA